MFYSDYSFIRQFCLDLFYILFTLYDILYFTHIIVLVKSVVLFASVDISLLFCFIIGSGILFYKNGTKRNIKIYYIYHKRSHFRIWIKQVTYNTIWFTCSYKNKNLSNILHILSNIKVIPLPQIACCSN